MRILVVDDNQDGARTMARGLQLLGHDTQVAFNGNSAVKLSGVFKPRVVLLDIAMSGIDGHETGRVIRDLLGTNVRIIAVTGLSSSADHQRSMEAGFDDHLGKPLDWNKLKCMLETLDPSEEIPGRLAT